jgi:hypothetical protein
MFDIAYQLSVYPLCADHWHAATSADGLEKRRDEPPHRVDRPRIFSYQCLGLVSASASRFTSAATPSALLLIPSTEAATCGAGFRSANGATGEVTAGGQNPPVRDFSCDPLAGNYGVRVAIINGCP